MLLFVLLKKNQEMKSKLSLLFALCCILTSFGQKAPKLTIKTGSIYQIPKGYWPGVILGDLKMGFVQTGFKKKNLSVFNLLNPI